MILIDIDVFLSGETLLIVFRQRDAQGSVVVRCRNVIFLDFTHIVASRVRACITLPADVVAVLVLLLVGLVLSGRHGQIAVVQRDLDVLFLKAGQCDVQT